MIGSYIVKESETCQPDYSSLSVIDNFNLDTKIRRRDSVEKARILHLGGRR